MLYRTCSVLALLTAAVAAGAAAPPAEMPPVAKPSAEPSSAATPSSEEAAPADPLKQVYTQAPLVAEFKIDTVQANPTVDPRLVWEARAALLDVLKGNLLPGGLRIHVGSVVRAFDKPRSDVEGRTYVAPLKPLGQAAQRRFQLVGPRAWPADSKEADRLRKFATTEGAVTPASTGDGLKLTVKPLQQVFPVRGEKIVEVRVTNNAQDSATYVQAPLVEKEGQLYLPGKGRILIRRTTGESVPDKGNVATGVVPPPPPKPALIVPGDSFVRTVNLDTYFTLPAGRYTFSMFLATPDGRGRLVSNGFSFQVGAVDLPEPPPEKPSEPKPEPTPPEVEPKPPEPEPVEPKPAEPKPAPAEKPPETPATAEDLPAPHTYTPGDASFNLAALLRPTKAVYTLGDPVTVEVRLINTGPRTVAVDPRLERTLTLTVDPLGDSPQPLTIRQVIPWPPDEAVPPPERVCLRESAFWGRTIDLNALYGKKMDAIAGPTAAELADTKNLRYERFGRNLFGFPKPGTYRVTATYTVEKPAKAAATAKDSQPWWTGDVQSNTITIRVEEKGKAWE